MSDELLDYPNLVREALRQVPRAALDEVARYGMPDPHHLYLSFRTQHPDVHLPAQLRDRYPEEMTVILQHQFTDLEVDDEGFAVTLSFSGVPGRIFVPFEALTAFVDPGVGFGLSFDASAEAAPEDEREEDAAPPGEDTSGDSPTAGGRVVAFDRFRKK